MSIEAEPLTACEEDLAECKRESKTLRVITWFSLGMALAALGVYVGAELRSRSKFKRRTPYDFYRNAGERQANEFGMGV